MKKGVLDIGGRIRELRLARHMGLMELAYKAGISMSGLANIEKGRTIPRIDTLAAIARVLEVGLGELLDDAASLQPAA